MHRLAWDLVWSSWRGVPKSFTYPERWVWVSQDGSCLCVARMTAMHSGLLPKIIFCSETLKVVMAPEKWLWWQGQRESIGGKKGRGENLSTQLRLLYNIKFGNWTRDIWSTCSLFFPLDKLICKYWSGFPGCFIEKLCQLLLPIFRDLLTILIQ